MKLRPDNCPRCDKRWVHIDWRCDVCNMYVLTLGIIGFNIMGNNRSGTLYYYMAEHTCVFIMWPNVKKFLPWLPYTITKEHFEKYLILI